MKTLLESFLVEETHGKICFPSISEAPQLKDSPKTYHLGENHVHMISLDEAGLKNTTLVVLPRVYF
jgi:hypothetical protein